MLTINYKKNKINDLVALTPYYGFGGSGNFSTEKNYPNKKESRIAHSVYFIKTIYGLKKYTDNVIVSVQNELDSLFVNALNDSLLLGIEIHETFCEGVLHPVQFLRNIKQSKEYEIYKYILYTESDQILYINTEMLNVISKNTTLSFHRIMKDHFKDNLIKEKWSNILETTINEEPHFCQFAKPQKFSDDRFVAFDTEADRYGAAYICHKSTFEKTDFKLTYQNPCERASFHVFEASENVVKTKNIFDAAALHLSGSYEEFMFHGYDINDFPELW